MSVNLDPGTWHDDLDERTAPAPPCCLTPPPPPPPSFGRRGAALSAGDHDEDPLTPAPSASDALKVDAAAAAYQEANNPSVIAKKAKLDAMWKLLNSKAPAKASTSTAPAGGGAVSIASLCRQAAKPAANPDLVSC